MAFLTKRIFHNPPPTTNPPGPKPQITSGPGPGQVHIHGDVKITFPNGGETSIKEILERLEALETIYMEDQLLGKKDT